ncbi:MULTISPECIES: hypothetical protein [unclassified Amycolatopsis]|uniref:hypothetical protein n=1 Tax=unclassified Amycolatopsis TaxID=2618356 RepID=UPI00287BBBAD|nr:MULTISPECIES: hypothetical protein [unclassified Amycolatopsis]
MTTSRFRAAVVTAVVAGLALVLLVVATAGDVYAPLGNADPGPLTTYGFAVVRFAADAAAAGCFGGLVFAAFVAPGRRGGSLSADAFAASRFAAGCAACWLAAAVVAVPFSTAVAAGLPVSRVLRPEVFLPTFSATEEPKAWLCVVAAAAVATALAWPAMAWRTVVAAAAVAGVGLLCPWWPWDTSPSAPGTTSRPTRCSGTCPPRARGSVRRWPCWPGFAADPRISSGGATTGCR